MFRLPAAQALINRMGFNNDGWTPLCATSKTRFHSGLRTTGGRQRMILGLNIGKNAATPIERATDDYLIGLSGVYPYADYVTVNISSPNTKNLRELQSDAALDALLSALMARQGELAAEHGRQVPLFLKIAPDLDGAGAGHRRGAAAPRHRRRDRHQHHPVARGRAGHGPRPGGRRPVRRAGARPATA